MSFRSQTVARVMASRAFMAVALGVALAGGAMKIALPTVQWLGIAYFLPTLAVGFAAMVNSKPQYKPTVSYPGGKLLAPLAMGLVMLTVLSYWNLGGTPSVIHVDGQMQRVAINHGKITPVSTLEFYWLVVSLPLGLTAVLAHFLLEHTWRWNEGAKKT